MITGFWVAIALTFAASVHCAGMCGGFAIAVSTPGARLGQLALHQLLLQLGKATSYAFLGALAGTFGAAVIGSAAFAWGGRMLAIVAGFALAAAGFTLLGLTWRKSDALAAFVAPAWSRFVAPLMERRPPGFPLVVGMAMGFLPCPLVYAGLAGAAASGSAASGAAIMSGVALGTVPALAATAALGSAITPRLRAGLARAAGILLIAVGVVTVWRGVPGGHAHHAMPADAGAMPACHSTK